jgi:hypothetical protein
MHLRIWGSGVRILSGAQKNQGLRIGPVLIEHVFAPILLWGSFASHVEKFAEKGGSGRYLAGAHWQLTPTHQTLLRPNV